MIKIKEDFVTRLDGTFNKQIIKIGDGSIITRFDKTSNPKNSNDVVCPHFLELKWAYGCPYSCSWCYLQGTYRWPQFKKHGSNIDPVIKDENKIRQHLKVISENGHKELLNSGELADSLMLNWLPKFILDIKLNGNKVLFLTKSNQVDFLVQNTKKLSNKIIMSFTLNAFPVSEKWEKGAPHVSERIKAAQRVSEAGYIVRIRIDPMVPIQNWESHYKELVDNVFDWVHFEDFNQQ
jgi:spore photoproduct lyase